MKASWEFDDYVSGIMVLKVHATLGEWWDMLSTDRGLSKLKGIVLDAERLEAGLQETAPATYLGEIPPKQEEGTR